MSQTGGYPANDLMDYAEATANFSLEGLSAKLQGNLETGLNACIECCDRHVVPGRVALNWESQDGRRETYSSRNAGAFRALRKSARLARREARRCRGRDAAAHACPACHHSRHLARRRGVSAAVHRLRPEGHRAPPRRSARPSSSSRTTPTAASSTKSPIAQPLPWSGAAAPTACAQAISTSAPNWRRQPASFEPVMRSGDDAFMLMSTSGTTGLPKGVAVPLKALLSFYVYMTRCAIDLRPDDKFWNIADPGWAYGLYYAVTGPLMHRPRDHLLRRAVHGRKHVPHRQEARHHEPCRLADRIPAADRGGPGGGGGGEGPACAR